MKLTEATARTSDALGHALPSGELTNRAGQFESVELEATEVIFDLVKTS